MLSRVADSLYWMSRYLERLEHTARVLDVHQHFTLELVPERAQLRFEQLLKALQITGGGHAPSLETLTFDPQWPDSISFALSESRENARQIREQISSEMYEQLNRLYLRIRRPENRQRFPIEPHAVYQEIKDGAHLFQGITDSTMTHGQGWHFIQLGRYLERAAAVANLLEWLMPFIENPNGLPHEESPVNTYIELLAILKSCTGFEAYCKVYSAELDAHNLLEFLLANPSFPHSVHFSVNQIVLGLTALAEATEMTQTSRFEPVIGRLQSELRYLPQEEILKIGVGNFLGRVRKTLNSVHELLYRYYLSEHFERSKL
jgi:uncharacterized alpha-E superfamily protein